MKPTVPAVAGSIRRKNVGAAARPMSRATAQPRASSASTVTSRIGVVYSATKWRPRIESRLVVGDEDRDQQRQQDRDLTLSAPNRPLGDVDGQADLLPRFAAGLEHPLEVVSVGSESGHRSLHEVPPGDARRYHSITCFDTFA